MREHAGAPDHASRSVYRAHRRQRPVSRSSLRKMPANSGIASRLWLIEGETEPELANYVDRIHWIKIGQLNKLIQALKDDGVREVVMLGGIKKTHVFTTVRPDFRALALAARLVRLKDDQILREVAAELEREGIQVRESTFGLQGLLVENGPLTKRKPSKKEWEDIRYGWEVAHAYRSDRHRTMCGGERRRRRGGRGGRGNRRSDTKGRGARAARSGGRQTLQTTTGSTLRSPRRGASNDRGHGLGGSQGPGLGSRTEHFAGPGRDYSD